METINIVFSSDNNYAQYMGVAICSLFENKKGNYLIDLYVLDGGIDEDNKNKLKVLEDRYNFKINYIKMDTEFFKDFYISDNITQSTYYRLMIPEILIHLDKILYLDCDIIINKDIYNLYNINIEKYFLAGVEDPIVNNERNKILDIPLGEKYLNTGVVSINLNKWREYGMFKIIINFIKKNPDKLKFWDQDAINNVLWGKWLNIPLIYNYLSPLYNDKKYNFEKLKKDIVVIHYAGEKPWNYLSLAPLNKYYLEYQQKTPWKNIYKNRNIKTILIKQILVLVPLFFPNFIVEKLRILKKKFKIKFY